MTIKSKALQVNLETSRVEVTIDPRYLIVQGAMSKFYGLADAVQNYLLELSHPNKNFRIIVNQTRGYALDYFHVLKDLETGPDVAALYTDILFEALMNAAEKAVRVDAADNLFLYVTKILKTADRDLERFIPCLVAVLDRLLTLTDEQFFLFSTSYYRLMRVGQLFEQAAGEMLPDRTVLNRVLIRHLRTTYGYWLGEDDPWRWYQAEVSALSSVVALESLYQGISHEVLNTQVLRLEEIVQANQIDTAAMTLALLALPGFGMMVDKYRQLPQMLSQATPNEGQAKQLKVLFLFHILNISGLGLIHEDALREINRTVAWLIGHQSHDQIRHLIDRTFSILKTRTTRFPTTALNCVLNMGLAVYKTDTRELVNHFADAVIDLGFHAPKVVLERGLPAYIGTSVHVQNIRTWLTLIGMRPRWSSRLLSHLVIYLAVSGVHIKDTDLFPRDVTQFLNSDIQPVYHLVKQLARLFPVYFNDIGAEGQLRDISTQVDELTQRGDKLVHYLRKQSHVESSNRIVGMMEGALKYWSTRNKDYIAGFLPEDLCRQITAQGEYIDGLHAMIAFIKRQGVKWPYGVIDLKLDEIRDLAAQARAASGASECDGQRLELIIAFYKLLYQKYNLHNTDMQPYLAQLRADGFPGIDALEQALGQKHLKKCLQASLAYLGTLKELILSEQTYEIREDIYKKRHITIDIPSMYGSYHEMKFDALGLTLRVEALVNVMFENYIQKIDLTLITKSTFYMIFDLLQLFHQALQLDGIYSEEFERQLEFLGQGLDTRGITFTQYLDIFKGFARAVGNIIHDYYHTVHEQNLTQTLSLLDRDQLLPKYRSEEQVQDPERFEHRTSEIFFRDRIALSLGMQQLDYFLSQILNTLFNQADRLPKDQLHQLLNYDPKRAMTDIGNGNQRLSGVIHLGNKGNNMVKLTQLELPVPPGFIISTEVFRCHEIIQGYAPAERNFKEQVGSHIRMAEKVTGKRFGNPTNPLLFSVRSGAPISQPGMLDTFLNVGINIHIVEGIARQTENAWFAWDNYRRFLQGYGMAFDLSRDDFDAIIRGFKQRHGIPLKREFTGEQMCAVAMSYKEMIQDAGIDVVENPFDQLFLAVKRVLQSWESPRARTYRKIMGMSDDWGTAVTIQEMVYGNLSPTSGSGVVFTHNPRWSEDSVRLWGDFTLGNQGEDVVSGLVHTLPISVSQQEIEMRDTHITMELDYPDLYHALRAWATTLVDRKGWSPQEIEFTFESPNPEGLYLLQTRDMTIRQHKVYPKFSPLALEQGQYLGHGIGVSGGAMSGRMVFSLEEIQDWRQKEPGTPLILARSDTVPDDIRETHAADGLLTARGGVTSHAAVVAHRLGKTCVVGCGNLVCDEDRRVCRFDGVGIKSGDFISIDGQEGSVFKNQMGLDKG